jgi:hypothetical protein
VGVASALVGLGGLLVNATQSRFYAILRTAVADERKPPRRSHFIVVVPHGPRRGGDEG